MKETNMITLMQIIEDWQPRYAVGRAIECINHARVEETGSPKYNDYLNKAKTWLEWETNND